MSFYNEDINSIRLKTFYNKEEIRQQVLSNNNGVETVILEQLINLKDQHIREALINLGWIPPK